MSRELDVRVAEVMGWTLWGDSYAVKAWLGTDGLTTGYCDQPWPDVERWGDLPAMIGGKGVWSPSTDIAAAWELVERWILKGKDNAFSLHGGWDTNKDLRDWGAEFFSPAGELLVQMYGTAPRAITRAFILAMDPS